MVIIINKKAKQLLPFAFLIALILIFFYKVVFLHEEFFFRDVLAHFLPSKHLWIEAVKGGELPLWNPYIQLGIPYLADLSNQALYFMNFIFVILPSKIALNDFIIIHYIICSFFTYLLCLNLAKNKLIGIISAVTFSLCGYCISLSCNPEYLSTIAWLPAIFWAYYQGLNTNKIIYYFLTSIFLSMLIFTGDPFSFYFAAGFILLRALFEIKENPEYNKMIITSILIIIFSLGIASVQLLPTYELSELSIRAGGLTFQEATIWSFHPLRLIEFIFPNYYGYHFNFPHYWGSKLQTAFFSDLNWSEKIYIGILPFIFAIYSLTNNRNKEKLFWLSFILISFVVALGSFTPLYKILYSYAPIFSGFRYPEKLVLFISFGLCILSAFGISDLLESKPKITSKTRQLIIALLIIASGTIIFDFSTLFNEESFKTWSISKSFINFNMDFQIIYLLLILTLLTIIIYLWQIKSNNKTKLLVTILAIIFADLFFINQKAFTTTKLDFQNNKPLYARAINKKWDKPYPPRLLNKILPYQDISKDYLIKLFEKNSTSIYTENLYGYLFKYYFDNLKPNRNLLFGIGSINTTSPLKLKAVDETIKKYIKTDPIKLIEEFGVNYILEKQDFTVIYTNNNIAYSLNQEQENYETLLKVNNPTPKILFSETLPQNFKEFSAVNNYKITEYSFNKIVFETNLSQEGYITILDSYYPGWKSNINGILSETEISNKLYRAIKCKKGNNKVELIFDPPSFNTGLLITLTSILIGVLSIIFIKTHTE